MKIRALLLAAGFALVAAAASAAAVKIVSFTGPITIKTAKGETITVKPGEKAPKLKAGDQVSVVSGQAVIEADGVKVTAAEGATFSVAVKGGQVSVAAVAGSVTIVKADGTSQTVAAGQTASAPVSAPAAVPSAAPAPTQNAQPSPTQEAGPSSVVSPSAP